VLGVEDAFALTAARVGDRDGVPVAVTVTLCVEDAFAPVALCVGEGEGDGAPGDALGVEDAFALSAAGVGDGDGVPVEVTVALCVEDAFAPVALCVGEGEGDTATLGDTLGVGDAETSTAMRIALLLWSATTIEPSAKATALDGLLKEAVAPSPLPKPDTPPKRVVADCVTGSSAITRLPPVSARSRRAPFASYHTPAGTLKRAAAPMPSTEACEPPPAKARAVAVEISTARMSKYHVSATMSVALLPGTTARPVSPRNAAAAPMPFANPGVVVPASVETVPVTMVMVRSRVPSDTKSEPPKHAMPLGVVKPAFVPTPSAVPGVLPLAPPPATVHTEPFPWTALTL